MPRPNRADEAGSIYHALHRGNARQTIFHKPEEYEAFLRVLGEGLERYPVELFAFTLMPNQWKDHFFMRDGHYGTTTKLEIPWLFNIGQDPYEMYEQAPRPRATLTQQKTYLFNDVMDRLGRHMASLLKYSPKQQGSSLSIGN